MVQLILNKFPEASKILIHFLLFSDEKINLENEISDDLMKIPPHETIVKN